MAWVDWHFVCTGLIGVWHGMGRLALCVYRADRCVAWVDWHFVCTGLIGVWHGSTGTVCTEGGRLCTAGR